MNSYTVSGGLFKMRILPTLCLGALIIAGCAAGTFNGPSAQEDPALIVVNNSATGVHTFEVWVVELPADVTVQRSDGVNATWEIDQGVGSFEPGDDRTYTEVNLPESARLHGRFTLDPGAENRSSIAEFPDEFAVVVIVYQDKNEIIEWVSANCDDADLIGLKVRSRDLTTKANSDVVVSFNCGH